MSRNHTVLRLAIALAILLPAVALPAGVCPQDCPMLASSHGTDMHCAQAEPCDAPSSLAPVVGCCCGGEVTPAPPIGAEATWLPCDSFPASAPAVAIAATAPARSASLADPLPAAPSSRSGPGRLALHQTFLI